MPVEPSQLIPMINKVVKNENCNKIFLVTEDLKYFNLIKKVYKNKLIFNKSFRANVNFTKIMLKFLMSIPEIYIDTNLEKRF